jgi:DNA repair exonuclease SbcCD ATPase subunit
MITNEDQYKITRIEADRFRAAINGLANGRPEISDVHPRLLQAEREAMESKLADLEAEMKRFENHRHRY